MRGAHRFVHTGKLLQSLVACLPGRCLRTLTGVSGGIDTNDLE